MSKPRANAAVQAVGTSLRRRFCVRLRTGWECFANGAENRGIRGRFPPVLFPRLRAPILPAREGRKTIGTNHILSRSPLWLHTRPFTEPTPFAFGGQGQDEARPASFSPSPLTFFVCLFISKRFARGVKNKRRGTVIFVPLALLASHPPFHGASVLRFQRARAG